MPSGTYYNKTSPTTTPASTTTTGNYRHGHGKATDSLVAQADDMITKDPLPAGRSPTTSATESTTFSPRLAHDEPAFSPLSWSEASVAGPSAHAATTDSQSRITSSSSPTMDESEDGRPAAAVACSTVEEDAAQQSQQSQQDSYVKQVVSSIERRFPSRNSNRSAKGFRTTEEEEELPAMPVNAAAAISGQSKHEEPTRDADTASPPVSANRVDKDSRSLTPEKLCEQFNTSSPSTSSPPLSSGAIVGEPPLRVGSVKPETIIAQPQPKPIVRSASQVRTGSSAGVVKQPIAETLNSHGGPYVDNIAQLEATAERLSTTTSSIDEAIRDLHSELKRSDSKRSSMLASSAQAASTTGDDPRYQLQPHASTASSIISTNNAARNGGYSPAAFVMSPTHSLASRLRSNSKDSNGYSDLEPESGLSRHGPGKSSVRSGKSIKQALADISETETSALNSNAFDAADVAPPIEYNREDEEMQWTIANGDGAALATLPTADNDRQAEENGRDAAIANLLNIDFDRPSQVPNPIAAQIPRPTSAQSDDTFAQARDAFTDFDGVHWEPNQNDYYEPPAHEPKQPAPRRIPATRRERPQSYFDHETGQQMLYYPARVPAMLNLPPKLSSKPKNDVRNVRRSQVLSAMVDTNEQHKNQKLRNSAMPNVRKSMLPEIRTDRESWLPVTGGQEDAFAALTANEHGAEAGPAPVQHPGATSSDMMSHPGASHDGLRRPEKLSRQDPRKSRISRMDVLPSQLRASAFFDAPSEIPEIAVKDGSAMATLDSILDASAGAPVSAFTDHAYAGKLGTEVYGREKQRASVAPSVALGPMSAVEGPKKRASFFGLGKRATSSNGETRMGSSSSYSALQPVRDEDEDTDSESNERSALTHSIDGESVVHRLGAPPHPGEAGSDEEAEDEDDKNYYGAPTTLLAELQLRKQQQKSRTQHVTKAFPQGMHATLLEMDAIAEVQRKERKDKRVNLAWEDPEAHVDQNGSDNDDDVPLAIIAAKNAGAKNMADLERPVGLMERRDMEDNEPLSRRRARLQGVASGMMNETGSIYMLKAQSALDISNTRLPGHSPSASRSLVITPDPENDYVPDDDDEEETLGERKKRLAAQEEAEGKLPRTRPVSRAFSEELLSEFGPPSEPSAKRQSSNQDVDRKENKTPLNPEGQEETLGQRRKRLQAEREARALEMSHRSPGGGAGGANPAGPPDAKRLSLADVLSAHPRREVDNRAAEEQARFEEEERRRLQRDAKLRDMRAGMQGLVGTQREDRGWGRSGGFRGGQYNDGLGGISVANGSQMSLHQTQSMSNMKSQMQQQQQQQQQQFYQHQQYSQQQFAQPYGSQMGGFQPGYGVVPGQMAMGHNSMTGRQPLQQGMMPNRSNTMGMQMQMPGAVNMGYGMPVGATGTGGPMTRVEQWRQGVLQ